MQSLLVLASASFPRQACSREIINETGTNQECNVPAIGNPASSDRAFNKLKDRQVALLVCIAQFMYMEEVPGNDQTRGIESYRDERLFSPWDFSVRVRTSLWRQCFQWILQRGSLLILCFKVCICLRGPTRPREFRIPEVYMTF